MSEIFLRSATLEDLPEIMQMEELGFEIGNREYADVYVERISVFPDGSLISETDGEICGCIFMEIWRHNGKFNLSDFALGHSIRNVHRPSDGNYLYIASMTIKPAFRGLSIGRRLFSISISRVKHKYANIRNEVLLVNETWRHARRIYSDCGFSEYTTLKEFFNPSKGVRQDGIIMTR